MTLRYTDAANVEVLEDFLMIACGKPKYWWDGQTLVWYD
jgi:hypothetical protein